MLAQKHFISRHLLTASAECVLRLETFVNDFSFFNIVAKFTLLDAFTCTRAGVAYLSAVVYNSGYSSRGCINSVLFGVHCI